ncbi:hypothetical protein [Halorubrum trueperi]|uniref:Uncharacterized protein n=1 Tax=Halorubrum trueperi TaxID=2004704 RepID=A0ABD5UKQ4_9EURY
MTERYVSHQQPGQPTERDDGALTDRRRRLAWLARAAGVGLSGVSIAFVLLVVVVVGSGGELTLITRPLPMQFALALPYLIGILTLGTVAGAVPAWRYRYWSLPARIHHTLLALLGLGFSWQLATLGFLAV